MVGDKRHEVHAPAEQGLPTDRLTQNRWRFPQGQTGHLTGLAASKVADHYPVVTGVCQGQIAQRQGHVGRACERDPFMEAPGAMSCMISCIAVPSPLPDPACPGKMVTGGRSVANAKTLQSDRLPKHCRLSEFLERSRGNLPPVEITSRGRKH